MKKKSFLLMAIGIIAHLPVYADEHFVAPSPSCLQRVEHHLVPVSDELYKLAQAISSVERQNRVITLEDIQDWQYKFHYLRGRYEHALMERDEVEELRNCHIYRIVMARQEEILKHLQKRIDEKLDSLLS